VSKARQAAKDSVPIEFEIERAKGMVTSLVPEIKKNMDVIAKEEVAINRLDQQITKLQDRMASAKDEILTLQTDLEKNSANTTFTYCSRTYTRSQVETDLAQRFERYKVDEATFTSLGKMKTMREESLSAAKAKLSEYMSQKRDLEVKLEQLSARLKMIDVAKTTSEYAFSEDKLGKAKALVEDLQGRLEVEERLVGAKGDLTNEVVLTDRKSKSANIVDKVAEYFGAPAEASPATTVPKSINVKGVK
jgi:chromosome segregation ATPase